MRSGFSAMHVTIPVQLTALLNLPFRPNSRTIWLLIASHFILNCGIYGNRMERRPAGVGNRSSVPRPSADEIFMAWNYARYVHAVAAEGKTAYNIPMYVNTWLAGEDATPGDYPSGGPQPRVVDIWKAAGKAIDIYTPDIYQANFAEWCRRYNRSGNPLFIPETNGAVTGGSNPFYAFGG